jgi:hypothetical protein
MYEQLRSRIGSMLGRPRAMKPQTQRQLASYLDEHKTSLSSFMLCAANVLEEHELDIVFGPLFTPTLDERCEVADLLFHWRPAPEQLARLAGDLCADVGTAVVRMPDGTPAELTLHEVMTERYVRLLRLENGPEPSVAAALRDGLPADLWPVAVALMCEPGMTAAHQAWFAEFVNHMAGRHAVSRGLLEMTADFLARQASLGRDVMIGAAEALMRATEGTAAYAASGHTYWSPDVAQHHHYRGQGNVDQQRLAQRRDEVAHVATIVNDLRTFGAAGELSGG